MFKKPEDMLDNEIQKLFDKGQSFNVSRNDLSHLAIQLKNLPKRRAPEPHRRRLYMTANTPAKSQFEGFRMLMLGASGVLLFVITFGALAIYTSNPSNKRLYSYKKTAERLQVNLATSPEAKARKELEIAEKRLNEARELISTNPDDPRITAAALTELAKQTEHVVATIEDVNKDSSEPDSQIAEKLDTLAKDQLALLNTIKPTPETEPATQMALSATQQIIAATNEEDSANLKLLPETITGVVTALGTKTITVGSTIIDITPETVIESSEEPGAAAPAVNLEATVTVLATKKDGKLLAEKIIIEELTEEASENEPVKKTQETKDSTSTDEKTTTPEQQPKPHEAKGSFILEDPNPQPIE